MRRLPLGRPEGLELFKLQGAAGRGFGFCRGCPSKRIPPWGVLSGIFPALRMLSRAGFTKDLGFLRQRSQSGLLEIAGMIQATGNLRVPRCDIGEEAAWPPQTMATGVANFKSHSRTHSCSVFNQYFDPHLGKAPKARVISDQRLAKIYHYRGPNVQPWTKLRAKPLSFCDRLFFAEHS